MALGFDFREKSLAKRIMCAGELAGFVVIPTHRVYVPGTHRNWISQRNLI